MKILVMIACVLTACCTVARPGPFRPVPPPRHFHHLPPPHHHHYHAYVSPLAGLAVGTFVGAAIASTANRTVVVQQPTVIQQPVVTAPVVQQLVQVWVPGHYEDQLQANGTTIRIWVPGHYEVRLE